MPTQTAANSLTLAELAKRHDPDGSSAVIAEVLEESNPILEDAPWQEANDTFSHMVTRRLYLPTGTHRKLNEGVTIEASRTINVRESVAMLESYSEVDKVLVNAAANPAEFRMNEARAFIEGMGQNMAGKLLYGDSTVTPEDPHGLQPRMASVAQATNVLNGGGSGNDNSSIYIVMWGLSKAFMVYPKGNKTNGIEHTDLGEVTLQDASGNLYQGYRDHFKAYYGLCVKDDRSIGRIANLEAGGETSNIFDEDDLIRLLNRFPSGPKVIYVEAEVATDMEIRLKDKNNVHYTPAEYMDGAEVVRFKKYPVKKVDQILLTEDTIS